MVPIKCRNVIAVNGISSRAVDVIGGSVAVAVAISAVQFLRRELGLPLICRIPCNK